MHAVLQNRCAPSVPARGRAFARHASAERWPAPQGAGEVGLPRLAPARRRWGSPRRKRSKVCQIGYGVIAEVRRACLCLRPSNVVCSRALPARARRFGAACSPIGTAYLEIALLGLCNERQLIRLWHRGYRRQIEARANRSRVISFTKQFRSGFLAVQFGNNSREKNFAQRPVLCLGPSVGICPCLCGGRCCAGQRAFQRCSGCHSTADQKKAGPGLGGIVGRPAGSMKGYRYSKALKSSGLVWDEATLDRFLAAPREVVPKRR